MLVGVTQLKGHSILSVDSTTSQQQTVYIWLSIIAFAFSFIFIFLRFKVIIINNHPPKKKFLVITLSNHFDGNENMKMFLSNSQCINRNAETLHQDVFEGSCFESRKLQRYGGLHRRPPKHR